MYRVNVIAAAVTMQESLRRFPPAGGTIINIGSTSGYLVSELEAGVYASTKFALRGLTNSVQNELRATGNRTRICLLSPGRLRTRLFAENKQGVPNAIEKDYLEVSAIASVVGMIVHSPHGADIDEIIIRSGKQHL